MKIYQVWRYPLHRSHIFSGIRDFTPSFVKSNAKRGGRYDRNFNHKNNLNFNAKDTSNTHQGRRHNDYNNNHPSREPHNGWRQGGSRCSNGQSKKNESSSSDPPKFSPNRRFFDRMINTGEAFQKPQDARRFLDAAVEYDDKLDLLSKLTSENGLKILRRAITAEKSDTVDFLRNHVLPLIKLLGCDELSSGMCLRSTEKLIKVFYEAPGFVDNLLKKYQKSAALRFCSSLKNGKIQETSSDAPERKEEEFVMGWFVLKCCTLIDKGKNMRTLSTQIMIYSLIT